MQLHTRLERATLDPKQLISGSLLTIGDFRQGARTRVRRGGEVRETIEVGK